MSGVIDSMMNFIYTGPVVPVYLFLLCVVFFRAQGTYWLGRYMGNFIMTRGKPRGGWRLRTYNWIHADSTARAIATLQRRGWPVIPFSFLTVGFQTMINMGAGVIRMTWPRYTAAMFPGCLAWALIYSTIGWTVWKAAFSAAAGSPLGILVIAVILFAAVWWFRHTKKVSKDISAAETVESVEVN
ncbi:MAG: VTT domain-containing protein [Trueperella sp.]|nr:VTT domain-containing protein [Trueperella sp.]